MAKEDLNIELARWNNKKEATRLLKHIEGIQMVKTIWQGEKAVNLMTFYCPSRVLIGNKRKVIECVEDLPSEKGIVIQGIAGQGKSIFLRHLCATELAKRKRVPVFLELRKITGDRGLMKRISESFEDYGLTYNEEAFAALYDKDMITLLLDGFDELDDQFKAATIWDIEMLITRFPKMRVIVTARPESEICHSAAMHVMQLCPLQGEEYRTVLEKLIAGDRMLPALLKAIKGHKGGIESLLSTPLIVTLLAITYKTFEKIPDELTEFYESVFNTLIWRHDKLKPGYRRPRKSGLNDTDFRKAFEGFCYYSKEHSKASYTEDQMLAAARKALAQLQLNASPDDLINDAVKITCLVVRDSSEYRFIHRSIQEFFAAAYVSKRPDAVARSFYEKMVSQMPYHRFEGELRFLAAIDRYRYLEMYALPSAKMILRLSDLNEIETIEDGRIRGEVSRIFRSVSFKYEGQMEELHGKKHFALRFVRPTYPTPFGHFRSFFVNGIHMIVNTALRGEGLERTLNNRADYTSSAMQEFVISIEELEKTNPEIELNLQIKNIAYEVAHDLRSFSTELRKAQSENITSFLPDL